MNVNFKFMITTFKLITTNTTDLSCRRSRYLCEKIFECDKFFYKPTKLEEYSRCKIVLKGNTS